MIDVSTVSFIPSLSLITTCSVSLITVSVLSTFFPFVPSEVNVIEVRYNRGHSSLSQPDSNQDRQGGSCLVLCGEMEGNGVGGAALLNVCEGAYMLAPGLTCL